MLKIFFKCVRFVLGGIIVTADKLFQPRAPKHSAEHRQTINQKSKTLALYQFASCPFCIKVRRNSKRLGIPLETRDILKNDAWHNELVTEGGKRKVPCLRIEKEPGQIEWLYESNAINAYLTEQFAA